MVESLERWLLFATKQLDRYELNCRAGQSASLPASQPDVHVRQDDAMSCPHLQFKIIHFDFSRHLSEEAREGLLFFLCK